jgi:ATP-binding cassette subfamily F protein uup
MVAKLLSQNFVLGEKEFFENFSFDFQRGARIELLVKNGTGKSTS